MHRPYSFLKSSFSRSVPPQGIAVRSVVIIAVLASLLVGGIYYGWGYLSSGTGKKSSVILVPVVRGTFIHEVSGKGSAESAKNVDITSQVEGTATVIWIIPEGESVKSSEELVLLDSSNIEDRLNTQQITYNNSLAKVASSQATLRTTELSLEEYIEGTFEQNWTKIENDIYAAKETQKQKADMLRFTERLVELGYTTAAQLDADKVAEQSSINTVKSSLLERDVLLRYSSEKKITELMSSIETARADVASVTYTNQLDKSRLDYYKRQFENCTIKAPQDGQVVYANQSGRPMNESEMIKEGVTVRERQVLIRLPDPMQMQVRAMINEASIASIRPGMKAKIAFDAISNRSFEGTVQKVNQYPEVVWMSAAKDYVTLIKIDNPIPEIRSGLTTEVRIVANKIEDVLMLPLQCVVEVDKKNYCLMETNGNWSYHEVRLGSSNDKQVVVLEGLSEGDMVVSGARAYKEKVTFPEVGSPSKYKTEEVAKDDKEETPPEEGVASAPGLPGLPALPGGAVPGAGLPALPGGAPGGAGRPGGGPPVGMSPGGGPGGMPAGMSPGGGPGGRDQAASRTGTTKAQELEAAEAKERALKLEKIQPILKYFSKTAMELCRELDLNNDKRITREEAQEVAPELLEFFGEWDRKSIGTWSQTDFVIGFCTCRNLYQKSLRTAQAAEESKDKEEEKQSKLQEFMTADPGELFTAMDKNKDGILSEDECGDDDEAKLLKQMLSRLDENGDGKVSRNEFVQSLTLLRSRMRGGAGPAPGGGAGGGGGGRR